MSQSLATENAIGNIAALSAALIHAVNCRDWHFAHGLAPEFVQHLSPSFTAQSDITSQQAERLSLAGQIAVWQQRSLQHPNAHFEIFEVDTKLVSANKASVVISMRVRGVDDVVLLAMNEFQWRRIGDSWWQCERLVGFRGSFWGSGGTGWQV